MQLKTILNRAEKQKGVVYTSIRWSEDNQAIWISIRPHARSRPVCSGCGKKRPGYDTRGERRFEFEPLWGFPVFFWLGSAPSRTPEWLTHSLTLGCVLSPFWSVRFHLMASAHLLDCHVAALASSRWLGWFALVVLAGSNGRSPG